MYIVCELDKYSPITIFMEDCIRAFATGYL